MKFRKHVNKSFKKVNKQKISHTHQGIYGLEKISSVVFLELKLLAEYFYKGLKIDYLPKFEGLLIQKRGNISIRCLAYSRRLPC